MEMQTEFIPLYFALGAVSLAAAGLAAWLLMSAASCCLEFVIWLGRLALFTGRRLTDEAVVEGLTVVALCLSALIMLLALQRLRPRV